eukprot:CAMPEP_0113584536 /NCGR_PEP_ID=MMETSP0015_2-20120614/33163_1 /TAXON_ID=2838 /ORGANISM="Odontella" /LENGTH=809 /DNA_ID=CAMNT_0000489607 /DNA_START=1127 /DNA_END=3553 /DNA_ORIENTATION=- /assembly_acc=CAM_ASM_000160
MGNSSSALPYAIGDETQPSSRPGSGGWAIHDGNRKSDSLPVTVFKASKAALSKTPLDRHKSIGVTGSNGTQIIPALHHFKKSKTLVHPNILQTHATLDTDYPNGDSPDLSMMDPSDPTALQRTGTLLTGDLIIVTERCVPLSDYLDGLARSGANAERAVAWGLHNLINALGFLHNAAKLCHGAVCPHSVFVTPAGDFKLSNFSLLTAVGIEDGGGGPTRHFRHFDDLACTNEYRSPERRQRQYDAIATGPVHSMDSFSLGAFVEGLYGHPSAGTNGQVPQQLRKAVQRLQTANARMRPRVIPLLKCPVFDSPHIAARDFLDNIAVKQSEEKIQFMQSLPDLLGRGVLDRDVAVHRILPVLVGTVTSHVGREGAMTQDVNRREVMAAMPALFYVAETYLSGDESAEEFKSNMTPVVELLFQINDRGVRGALLGRVPLLATRLDDATLNSAVFEPMCSGFSDSSGPLRELTLKSTVVLVPKLLATNLEKLSRYLVRLQADPETSIRTNTVIFIGKIAPHLGENSRQKLILPAFARAMRDEFMPCRLAGLKAVRACREFYDPRSVAEKVLPAVCPHLMDGAADVRSEAFSVLGEFLGTLREESNRMATQERSNVAAGQGQPSAMGGMGAAGGSSDLFPSSTAPPPAPAAPAPAPAPAVAPTSSDSSGGYFSGFGSWAATKITASAQASSDSGPMAPAPAPAPAPAASSAPVHPVAKAPAPAPQFASLSLTDANIGGYGGSGKLDISGSGAGGISVDNDGGWSDDDGFGETDLVGAATSSSGVSTPNWAKDKEDNEDEDFFATFESSSKPRVT